MGTVFIAWNDLGLAHLVADALRREFRDEFIVGAQTSEISHFGAAAFFELDVCDKAIVLIAPSEKYVMDGGKARRFFSPNQFLEMGYALARMPARNVTIILVDIDPAELPSDILGTRVISLPAAEPVRIAELVVEAYRSLEFTEVSEFEIFNDWPKYRRVLADVARAPESLANSVEVARAILHSIQAAFYYGEIEILGRTLDAMRLTGALGDVATIVTMTLRHYRQKPFHDHLDDFVYHGPDPWIGIIGRDFSALRHINHAQALRNVQDLESARFFAEKAGLILDSALSDLEQLPSGLYVNLWKGYLYLNQPKILRFLRPKDPAVQSGYERAIQMRHETIREYAKVFRDGQPNLILSCLEQECDLAQIRYFAYCLDELGVRPDRLLYHINGIRGRLESMKRRNDLWGRVESELAALRF